MKERIAVTGGIGSGKSTVLKLIGELGYPTFSCDQIYREVIHSPTYVQKIAEIFPDCVQNDVIDRNRLSSVVFTDEKKRELLNSISHPLIMERLEEKMNVCQSELVFAEVPLLFEGGYEKEFDKIIVVMRKKEERIKALLARDGADRGCIERKMLAQLQYDGEEGEKRLRESNVMILQNDEDENGLKKKIKEILSILSSGVKL